MGEFDQELRIQSIEFMIDACEYHLQRIRKELQKFSESELTSVPEHEKEEAIKIMQSKKPQREKLHIPIEYGPSGNIKSIPITITPDSGNAILIYEFNSFSTVLMACVNYLVDLKLRLLDGHKGESSKTIGWYMHSTNKSRIKNKGDAHRIIGENYTWVELIKKIRDRVNHSYIQSELHARIVPYRTDSKLMSRTEILLPYVFPSLKSPTLIKYCERDLQKLKAFKISMFRQL